MLLSVLDSVVFDYDSPTIASRCCHTVGGSLLWYVAMWLLFMSLVKMMILAVDNTTIPI